MKSYTLDMALDRAGMLFEWRFDELANGRTRITQLIVLNGENSAAYLAQVQSAFTSSLAAGMSKIAAAMERAAAGARDIVEQDTAGEPG